MTQQQRMVLAIVLSFLFFVAYDFLLPKSAPVTLENNQSTTIQQQSNIQTNATSAPAPMSIAQPESASAQTSTAPIQKTAEKTSEISDVHTPSFHAKIDSLGRISLYEVLLDKFKTKDGKLPNLVDPTSPVKPLEIRFSDPALNEEAFKVPYTASSAIINVTNADKVLTLTQKLSKVTVTKKITFHTNGTYSLQVQLSNPVEYYISPGFRPKEASSMYTFKGVLVRKADGTIDTVKDGGAKGNEVYMKATVISACDKYFATTFYNFKNGFDVYITKDAKEDPLAFVKGSANLSLDGYAGAKEHDKLSSIDPRLTDIIEYGFFTFLAKPMFVFLKTIYNYVGNWGWAIVLTTILLRLILFPLTYKGMVSMNRLKVLSPKVKEIQKKYKGEPQKMNAKMMELYKKNNANPMGGCLPMILQIPVFFAIYRVLLNAVELKHAPWMGWIHDLSAMDPYYILPVLMAGTMFWQQRLTPNNFTDPMQEKIMKFLPLIFMFFFVTFPAGLTLYWFVNNLFGVAQQYYVNSIFKKEKAQKAAA